MKMCRTKNTQVKMLLHTELFAHWHHPLNFCFPALIQSLKTNYTWMQWKPSSFLDDLTPFHMLTNQILGGGRAARKFQTIWAVWSSQGLSLAGPSHASYLITWNSIDFKQKSWAIIWYLLRDVTRLSKWFNCNIWEWWTLVQLQITTREMLIHVTLLGKKKDRIQLHASN